MTYIQDFSDIFLKEEHLSGRILKPTTIKSKKAHTDHNGNFVNNFFNPPTLFPVEQSGWCWKWVISKVISRLEKTSFQYILQQNVEHISRLAANVFGENTSEVHEMVIFTVPGYMPQPRSNVTDG